MYQQGYTHQQAPPAGADMGPQGAASRGYNPLVEMRGLEYPPASEVGRGKYRHLFQSGRFVGSGGPRPGYGEPQPQQQPPAAYGGAMQGPADGGYSGGYGGPDPSGHGGYGGGGGGGMYQQGPPGPMDGGGAPYGGGYGGPPGSRGGMHRGGRGHHGGHHGGGHGHGGGGGGVGGGGHRIMSRYKTKLCSFFMDSNGAFCPHGPACQFAHGLQDLRAVPGVPAPTPGAPTPGHYGGLGTTMLAAPQQPPSPAYTPGYATQQPYGGGLGAGYGGFPSATKQPDFASSAAAKAATLADIASSPMSSYGLPEDGLPAPVVPLPMSATGPFGRY